MQKDRKERLRQVVVGAVCLLLIVPATGFALAERSRDSRELREVPESRELESILNVFIARLCALQAAHRDHIQLIDPALCEPEEPEEETGRLVVDKVTIPAESAAIFSVTATGTGAIMGSATGTTTSAVNKEFVVAAGTYSVTEANLSGWVHVSNTCTNIVVGVGETKTCTITNARLPRLTVTKMVVNDDGGTATTTDFTLMIDGNSVTSGAVNIVATGTRLVSEGAHDGYTSTIGGECVLDGSIMLEAGDIMACTVTNDDIAEPPIEGAVVITEIMYDPASTDINHEWIEVMNGTNQAVDFTSWKFFEANTNHALALVQGNAVVQAGGFLVIADNATQFLVDLPAFTGTLFDSAFSLSNVEESIAIKDGDGVLVDEVTYSSDLGASNDGNSLQKSGDGWVAATPTPGL